MTTCSLVGVEVRAEVVWAEVAEAVERTEVTMREVVDAVDDTAEEADESEAVEEALDRPWREEVVESDAAEVLAARAVELQSASGAELALPVTVE